MFFKHAEESLEIMDAAAGNFSAKGVAIISFIPGEETKSWISKMKVIGSLSNEKANFLAIAGSKAAEMATTYMDSGSGVRKPLNGELGYKGGVIRKVKCGYIVASFSGSSGEIDAKISKAGLDFLSRYY